MKKNKIPKIIHQIWIGDHSKKPTNLMETWKMKGWEYRLWTEKEISELGLKNRELFTFFYKNQNWHGASDVARIEILERFGGIYIDADTERLESLDDAYFVNDYNFFSVEANKPNGVPAGMQRIANGVIGSVSGHRVLQQYIEEMGNAQIPGEVLPPWSTIGGTMLTKIIYSILNDEKYYNDKDILILSPHTFYPFDSQGNISRTSGKVFARHIWGTTHKKYGKI